MRARLVFGESIEKETSTVRIRKIANQKIKIGFRLGHSAHSTRSNRSYKSYRTYFFLSPKYHNRARTPAMRPHAQRLNLTISLVVDPAFDQLWTENVALQQKVVIGFERLDRKRVV